MDECIFCDILAGIKPGYRIFEDEKTLAILDIFPIARGHTLVIPKAHSKNLFDIEPEDIQAVALTIRRVAQVLKTVLECDGINIFQGNEKAAMQEIMHTHFHVLPRWYTDKIVFGAQRETLKEDPALFDELKNNF
ncbi:MAG: HIT family protein [Candidatus Hodarchaeales archaeon]|jgi:histidine triad (HIT) family protein